MAKRTFRRSPPPSGADYPTLDEFDRSRRRFLLGLGGLLGAGALAACGNRAVHASPDGGSAADTLTPGPDGPVNMGGALPPPAQLDQGPDTWEIDGEPPMPDARVDQPIAYPGEAPQPDAQVDTWGVSGGAPQPPAKADGGCDDTGCPNP